MAEIAVALTRALAERAARGTPGVAASNTLARGEGWDVSDVVCTSGPDDRPFEEQHANYSIAIVLAGSFQYRSALGHAMMTPGSLMLGNAAQCFECGHEHAHGDRCVAFWFTPDYFDRIVSPVLPRRSRMDFNVPRLPAIGAIAPLVARAGAAVTRGAAVSWEEIGVRLAASAARGAAGVEPDSTPLPLNATARITRAVRAIERQPDAPLTLASLARHANLSPYHFLRTFERIVGITPHQYVRRARLRDAAVRLACEPGRILDVALDCGFGDVSNFNRAFRTEFGVNPRAFRAARR